MDLLAQSAQEILDWEGQVVLYPDGLPKLQSSVSAVVVLGVVGQACLQLIESLEAVPGLFLMIWLQDVHCAGLMRRPLVLLSSLF